MGTLQACRLHVEESIVQLIKWAWTLKVPVLSQALFFGQSRHESLLEKKSDRFTALQYVYERVTACASTVNLAGDETACDA